MPKIVDSLPKTERGRARKYEFIDELYPQLEGTDKAAELIPGEDFECSTASMRQYLYRDAAERDLKAKVRTYEDEQGREIVVFAVEKLTQKEIEKRDEKAKKAAEKKASGNSGSKESKASTTKEPVGAAA